MSDDYIKSLAAEARQAGVELAFGVLGGGPSLSFIREFEAMGGRYIPAGHEAAAVMMAGAACRKGQQKAMSISIKGPGLANALPGLLSCAYEARPLLHISEAYGDSKTGFLQAHKGMRHDLALQEFIKLRLPAGCGKKHLADAMGLARQEMPGVVHLELAAGVESSPHEESYVPESDPAAITQKELVASLAEFLAAKQRPCLILGSLALRHRIEEGWEGLGVPVLLTAAAKGIIDENDPAYGGCITGEIKELSPEKTIIEECDAVIAIGLKRHEVVKAAGWQKPAFFIDTEDIWHAQPFNPDIYCVISRQTIEESLAAVRKQLAAISWMGGMAQEKRKVVLEQLDAAGWLPARTLNMLAKVLPTGTVVVPDTGLFCTVAETVWLCNGSDDFCGSSCGRYMGASIPTAIGIAAAEPERHVLCIVGDGGIRQYFQEIALAVEYDLPITFLYMSDGGYGTFSVKADGMQTAPAAMAWEKAAQSLGLPSYTAENEIEFAASIDKKNLIGCPSFIRVNYDPESYRHMADNLR